MEDVFIYDHVRSPRGKGRPEGALHVSPPVQLVIGPTGRAASGVMLRQQVPGRIVLVRDPEPITKLLAEHGVPGAGPVHRQWPRLSGGGPHETDDEV